jgi:phosphorylated CTD-interacting factor 1
MGKKRRRQVDPQPLLNLDGGGAGVDSIESCLADLEEATNPLHSSAKKEESQEEPQEHVGFTGPSVTPLSYNRRERVASWDSAWVAWLESGNYMAGLLPCFETELARHFQMKKLSSYLLESCKGLKMPAFERWLLDSKLEEKQMARLPCAHRKGPAKGKAQHDDPVLAKDPSIMSLSSQRLLEEMCETGVLEREAAQQILEDLLRRTKSALVEIHSQHLRCVHQTPAKSDRIEVEHGKYLVSMLYSRKKWKSPFIVKITISHYEKLKERFLRTHDTVILPKDFDSNSSANKRKQTRLQHTFHLLLMVITLRYSSFSGGQLLDDFRGGGMQGAIHEHVFEVLKDFFPKEKLFESFASPLNVTLPFFASAFEELDWHFGSVGDLALCDKFTDGCCGEANPPFTPGYMEFLSEYVSRQLAHADEEDRALSFVVVIPSVHDKDINATEAEKVMSAVKRFAAQAHAGMVQNSACSLHIVLPAKEHGYVEGAQHLRPTRYKRSLYDTSVILLQSKKAQEAKLDKQMFESSIRGAFSELHTDEHKKRKLE